ncbi:MAG: hypothetical protein KatS3mg071_2746 [Meiothermus sp.]|nr:MAG: hypothetical protein KatS3mg071_2746 [Meiothermus sp.]
MPPFDLQALLLTLLSSTLDTLFTFANGAIPALLVAWLTDTLLKAVPFLRPFRENIKQWILARIEELRLKRAEQAVLAAGQKYKADLQEIMREYNGNPPPAAIEASKAERLAEALHAVSKIASPGEARLLVEAAVANLKRQGVNP